MKDIREALDMPLCSASEEGVSPAPRAGSSLQNFHRVRVLVAIASFGEKNLEFLRKIIHDYRSMAMDVHLVVNSEAPKNLGAGVKVVVGFPGRNPHSLPFAHKQIFVENIDRYDLFVYSEDDIGVKEQSIRAFLQATADLEPDEIAGYIRYEIGKDGTVSLPDVHGQFHWKPESVRRRGSYTVAEFTNEHAGFYILTQAQLRRAIASGEYLRSPYEGRYGMLETAATDPYTCCGFRKVICISALDEFLIHHMPNRYVGVMGIPLTAFKEQIQTLRDIQNGISRATRLCEVEPKVLQRNWSKSYYVDPDQEILRMVPEDAATILSVGCGWGATEVKLKLRGSQVTALPLDSVIGASVARQDIEVVSGTLAECSRSLSGRKFDCVLMSNLLHLLPDPWSVLREYASFVRNGGGFVIAGYNFDFLPYLLKRRVGIGDYRKLRDFNQSGVHPQRTTTVKRELQHAGFQIEYSKWFDPIPHKRLQHLRHWPGQLTKRNWIIKARRVT
jgi:SAM-dependent methyltransferase